MTREERIAKLKAIQLCVCNLTATYDMGLQIDVLTSEGLISSIGQYGQWPCFEFTVTNDIISLQQSLVNNEPVSDAQMLDNNIVKALCTNHDSYNGEWMVSGDLLTNALAQIKKSLIRADLSKGKSYVYVSFEGNDADIRFFASIEDLKKCFIGSLGGSYSYDEMDDDEIEIWYENAKECQWDRFFLTEI